MHLIASPENRICMPCRAALLVHKLASAQIPTATDWKKISGVSFSPAEFQGELHMAFFRKLKNVLCCHGWSFRFAELEQPPGVSFAGDIITIAGRVQNNGIRLGTVYVQVVAASSYSHERLVFDSSHSLSETERSCLRLVDLPRGTYKDFGLAWQTPTNLSPGVYDIQFRLWSPPKLFARQSDSVKPYMFARTPWYGWIELVKASVAHEKPRIWISYAWRTPENERHKAWVTDLAQLLKRHYLDVVIDTSGLRAGDSLREWARLQRDASDVIILVCSKCVCGEGEPSR